MEQLDNSAIRGKAQICQVSFFLMSRKKKRKKYTMKKNASKNFLEQ